MTTGKCLMKEPVDVLRLALRLSLVASAISLGHGAYAADATGPLTVSATVTSSCTVGASTLAFPSATSAAIAAGNVDATGTLTVNCTSGSPYTIALDAGTGVGATVTSRKMSAGAQLLSYSVYTTTARTTVWGDGTAASVTVPETGTGASQSIPVYGRIFSGQVVTAQVYSDTINITVAY